MLDLIASYFGLSDEAVRNEIWGALKITADALKSKGISYVDLRNALVPQRDRLEIALLFDSDRIDSGWYGYAVAERLIPLLPRNLLCSMPVGDLLIDDQDLGFTLLERHVITHRPVEVAHTSQLYCVYLNNLTPTTVNDITAGLRTWAPFVGYADVSTGSRMKDWLSATLVTDYLKAREVVINSHEDDLPESHDQNTGGWPWEGSDRRPLNSLEKKEIPCRSRLSKLRSSTYLRA
jgi:hypothetical protein